MTKMTNMTNNKKLNAHRRSHVMMLAVLIPGLVISVFGIFSISRQQKNRELDNHEKYTRQLDLVRREIEDTTARATQNALQQITPTDIPQTPTQDPTQYNRLQTKLKALLLKHPIIKYPFLISQQGEFIFPAPGKIPVTVVNQSIPVIHDPAIRTLYQKGENLEFKERDFHGALRFYLKCLQSTPRTTSRGGVPTRDRAYFSASVGRCYFKMRKFPQALSYYRDGLELLSKKMPDRESIAREDVSLYFLVLRRMALCYQAIGRREQAVSFYLRLYDEILKYEDRVGGDRFAFLKNGALEFLDQNIGARKDLAERDLGLSGPDLSLGWRYFDYTPDTGNSPDRDALHYSRIREFYLPDDEKSRFYKAIKDSTRWSKPTGPQGETGPGVPNVDVITIRSHRTQCAVIFKALEGNGKDNVKGNGNRVYFGFMISPAYLDSGDVTALYPQYPDAPEPYISIAPPGGDDNRVARLVSLPFSRFYPGKRLGLWARDRDFFVRDAAREIRFNYLLMASFILVFALGLYLLYRYQSRESELVRLKSDFTDSASHSLKTPLTRIRMLAEKLHLGWVPDKAKQKEYLRIILSETDRMTEMITNMLDFSKIESGARRYHFESTNLADVVNRVADSHRDHLDHLGFQLHTDIADNLPATALDGDAMATVVANLLQNAVNYSADGGPKYIAIGLRQQGGHLVLEVEDRGIGMEQRELKRIFQRFYRVGSRTAGTGSGLGLFLVRHAVEAHGGEVCVESELGKGSRFIIRLPVKKMEK